MKILPSFLERFVRYLYNWTKSWAQTKHSLYALFIISFMESSFFPIPPDVLLIPMVVSNTKRWIRCAFICSLASVLGAIFGYYIGFLFFETVGTKIVEFYNIHQAVEAISSKYQQNAFLTVFIGAFTPILPYKAITITAGLFKIALPSLIVASVIGRAGRFFLVAGLIRIWGNKIQIFIEKHLPWLSVVFTLMLIGGFVVLKYLL